MNNNKLQTKTNIFTQQTKTLKNKQSLRNIRQDNSRFLSARIATRQPALVTKINRALPMDNVIVCSEFPNSHQNRTEKLTLWVKPIVKHRVERIARQEKLSLSAAGAAYLERSVQQDIDLQYTALLEPVIKKAIDSHLRQFKKANTHLLVRIAFDVGQIRGIVTNILGHMPGMTQNLLKTILADSARTAKGNITRRTPQLADLIEKLQKWLLGGDEEEKSRR